jgi:DNA-binding protein HU-beta
MNKLELVKEVSRTIGTTQKDSDIVLTAVLDCITETLAKGEEVKLVGFGTFYSKSVGERQARNPKTGEVITVEPKVKVGFKFSNTFKKGIQDA